MHLFHFQLFAGPEGAAKPGQNLAGSRFMVTRLAGQPLGETIDDPAIEVARRADDPVGGEIDHRIRRRERHQLAPLQFSGAEYGAVERHAPPCLAISIDIDERSNRNG